jgi:hypothetical protein
MATLTEEARTALRRLGLEETQLWALRVGIYTIRNVGGGLRDFLTFESRAQAAAAAVGAKELELMGVEITHAKLRAVLERGGFVPTTMPVPEELGGGTFNDVISRVEPVIR